MNDNAQLLMESLASLPSPVVGSDDTFCTIVRFRAAAICGTVDESGDGEGLVTIDMPDADAASIELFRTATGEKLHIRPCPHVLGVELLAATDADRAARAVCSWCAAEISGLGRTYHDTVEAALDDMQAPQHARPELARLLKEIEFDTVFVPYSRSYVAVAKDGKGVAWAGKTYVAYADGRPFVALPDYAPGGGGGAERNEAWGAVCPSCFTQQALTGRCNCE